MNLKNIYICIALGAVIGLLIYYFVYTAKINKRIQSGEVSGKKLIDIPKIIMIVVIAVLFFYCVLLSHSLKNVDEISRNDYVIINVEGKNEEEYYPYGGNPSLIDASYAAIYSKENNAGYNKEVIKDGDYIFTIFKRKSLADNFHPDFLCYAEYKGKKDGMIVYNTSSFVSVSDPEDHLDSSCGGYGISDCLLFIGNLDVNSEFKIRFDLVNEDAEALLKDASQRNQEEDKNYFPDIENFAASSAEVTINLTQIEI